jgi:tRNA (cytidine/uridine-2'-O-)-methyltransferase
MFNVVLVHPEIPPNTGNVIRLCANTGARLHLVEPLGFPLDDSKMRRAGLDYHEWASMQVHPSWEALQARHAPDPARVFALSTRGTRAPSAVPFAPDDWLIFGSEGAGLPSALLESVPPAQRLRLPMRPGNRSLNLSNAVAIVVFEAWRQHDFAGGN